MNRPALHLVNPETGEIHGDCPDCTLKDDRIKQLKRDLKSWMLRAQKAERDKAVEARAHPLWPTFLKLHAEWRQECRHPRSKPTVERFWEAVAFIDDYGEDMCRRAIAGARFDPHKYRRKNGSVKRCDEWPRIFSKQFEDFANRAPVRWTP